MASKELQTIIAARECARAQGRRAALVTVVKTSGSTYRRPGARMLVLESPDGEANLIGADLLGSISGGCLEDDAREHALAAIVSGRPEIIRYDTTAESDILFGTGAGCQGIVHAFIEPLPLADTAADPLACIASRLSERRAGALASVIGVEPAAAQPALGSFLWVDAPGHGKLSAPHTTITDPELSAAIAADARSTAFRGQAEVRRYPLPGGGHAEVFHRRRASAAFAVDLRGGSGCGAARPAGQGTRLAGARRRRPPGVPTRANAFPMRMNSSIVPRRNSARGSVSNRAKRRW